MGLLILLLAISSTIPEPVERCSVGTLRNNPEGYVWPEDSIRGFVTRAEAIVRVRATHATEAAGSQQQDEALRQVHFDVIDVLRGDLSTAQLTFPGYLTDKNDYNPMAVPYRMVRRSGQRGSCLAMEYKKGAEYLLILRTLPNVLPLLAEGQPVNLTPSWAPLAPLNEQIRGAADPWLLWVTSVAG